MAKFRKKPVVIDAFKFTGDPFPVMRWMELFPTATHFDYAGGEITIPTLEGSMVASTGDWIIRGVKGEFYLCKPDIFEATYEPAE